MHATAQTNKDGRLHTKPISLVIFDLGRVLLRICDDVRHACSVAGVAGPAAQLTPEQKASVHAYVCAHETGQMSDEEYCRANAELLGMQPADAQAMLEHYILGPYPGAIELVEELSRTVMRTACLSNTNPAHWRLMYDQGSPAYFPLARLTYQFASQVIRARKPDAAIYAFVEKTTGVPPAEMLFFDDRFENVQAALQRGWHAHHVQDVHDPITEIRASLRRHQVLS